MLKLTLCLLLGGCALLAEGPVMPPRADRIVSRAAARSSKTLWRYSVATVCLANVLDAQSSWGKYELNRGLAGRQGTFGPRGVLLKLSIQAFTLGVERLVLSHRPSGRLHRFFAAVNFADAAATGSVAARNYMIPRR
jgi:hypothetical protein